MLVFTRKKLAFLCQSKTGSTSYHRALSPFADIIVNDPSTLKHASIQRFDRFMRPLLDIGGINDVETLGVIREPISWLSSWYRYRARPFLDGKPNSTKSMSFSAFCEAYIQDEQPGFANVGWQYKFLFAPNPKHRTDHVIRYENQTGLLRFLEERLEVKLDVPTTNVSPKMDIELDPKVAVKVRKHLSKEYELWESLPDH